jgi:superoxide dismutase, Cu-Zn family
MKNEFFLPFAIAGFLAFTGIAAATITPAPPSVVSISSSSPENQAISLYGNNRQIIGRAAITEGRRGILVQLEVRGLIAGWHGLHINNAGDCSDNLAFQTAGPTLALKGEDHGFLNANGPQQGDFPNIWVGQDGIGRAQFFNTLIHGPDLHKAAGSALVIYDTEDDFKSDLTGQPGNRIGCGVISPTRP